MYKKQLILGVAIGIFISNLIFYISFNVYENKNNITDEYIIDRASELGMIFSEQSDDTE